MALYMSNICCVRNRVLTEYTYSWAQCSQNFKYIIVSDPNWEKSIMNFLQSPSTRAKKDRSVASICILQMYVTQLLFPRFCRPPQFSHLQKQFQALLYFPEKNVDFINGRFKASLFSQIVKS